MHGSARSSATSATRSNHRVSSGSSACVTTSGTSMPCARSTRRHRAPTSWYAKTTARVIERVAASRGSAQDADVFRGLVRRFDVVGVAFEHGADHVARPLAHLLVDPAHVLAEQADAEHDAADQEEREDVAVPEGLDAFEKAAHDGALDDDHRV